MDCNSEENEHTANEIYDNSTTSYMVVVVYPDRNLHCNQPLLPYTSYSRAIRVRCLILTSFILTNHILSAGSYFGHDPRNPNVYMSGLLERAGFGPNTATLSILANLPQLILSICYLAYNGLLTRIFSEFEWAGYSQVYKSLRVTQRKGEQLSTYRLQLPLHWSIPLLVISTVLHWLFSNCLYIIIYEGEWRAVHKRNTAPLTCTLT